MSYENETNIETRTEREIPWAWRAFLKAGENPLTFFIPALAMTYVEYKLNTNLLSYTVFATCIVMLVLVGYKIGEWKLPFVNKAPNWFQELLKSHSNLGE